MMLAMTHRYIFLLAETAGQMFESRQSRTVGVLDGTTQRRMTARTAGVLLSRSVELSNEVFLAMQSRGFRGDVKVLSEFRMSAWDYAGLTLFLVDWQPRSVDGKIMTGDPIFEVQSVNFEYEKIPALLRTFAHY